MSDLIQKSWPCGLETTFTERCRTQLSGPPDIPPTALADEAQEPVPPQPSQTLEAAP